MADNTYDIFFENSCTILVWDLTGCRKTRLLRRIIEHLKQLIEPPPQQIIWVFSKRQKKYDRVLKLNPNTEFIHNWNKLIYDNLNVEKRNLLKIENQMTKAFNCKTLVK